MKRLLLIALLLTAAIAASAQSAIYNRFANRSKVQAYCVEHYRLLSGDTVSVTLLTTGDSAVYRSLRKELFALPHTPRQGATRAVANDNTLPPGITREQADSAARAINQHKHLILHAANALPGDDGWYHIYYPSDRMVILIFLVHNEKEQKAVIGHMTYTEFH